MGYQKIESGTKRVVAIDGEVWVNGEKVAGEKASGGVKWSIIAILICGSFLFGMSIDDASCPATQGESSTK